MKSLAIFLLVLFGVLVAIGAAPVLLSVATRDVLLVLIFAVGAASRDRISYAVAIGIGFFADLYSALPFGTFTVLFPFTLRVWQRLGESVFTNRSFLAESARAAAGALAVDGCAWMIFLIAQAIQRRVGVTPLGFGEFVGDTIRSMILVGVVGAGIVLFIQKIQAGYAKKFLRRGI